MDNVRKSGELRFATVEGPATYYETPSGPAGFEYELARKFADKIGVKLKIIIGKNNYDVISMIANNKAAIGGAALTSNNLAEKNIKFGPSYYSVPQQLVYHRGYRRPDSLSDIQLYPINITAYQMQEMKEKFPRVSWSSNKDNDTNSLLRMVQSKEIRTTIVSSYQVNLFKHIYPDISVAFNITKPQPVAWIYHNGYGKLDQAITEFFGELIDTGELDQMIDRYFGHMIAFDYIDVSTFLTRIKKRFPKFEKLFRDIAVKNDLDWTLLAAMSYQESHWNESARSVTGVKGLMMLTQDTANQLKVTDRTDPEQSIDGGARYYNLLMEMIPARIENPDRTWMALAAYNVGIKNLDHARVITQKNGGNPDSWSDVRKTMLLLAENPEREKRKSAVRWNEPVKYVRNIRKYRDILRWIYFENGRQLAKTGIEHVLSIDLPVL